MRTYKVTSYSLSEFDDLGDAGTTPRDAADWDRLRHSLEMAETAQALLKRAKEHLAGISCDCSQCEGVREPGEESPVQCLEKARKAIDLALETK